MLWRNAPAKLNLRLSLLGPRRADGFTPLQSLVMPVSLEDTLYLTWEPALTFCLGITCNWPELLQQPETNLVCRAFRAFWKVHPRQVPPPVRFQVALTKRIPYQAGLGGGSSDAAAMLLLCQQWCLEHDEALLSAEQLQQTAAGLGSDVPLFLHANTPLLWLSGRGETLTPLPHSTPPSGVWLLVKDSELAMPTAQAYAVAHQLKAYSAELPVSTPLPASAPDWTNWFHNDFEAVVEPLLPGLADIRQALMQAGAVRVLLCGSGSALAGWFPGGITTEQIAGFSSSSPVFTVQPTVVAALGTAVSHQVPSHKVSAH